MARIIPSDISPLALAGAHSRELKTLVPLLKDQLGPDYAVFHSVHWSFSQGQGTRFGEIGTKTLSDFKGWCFAV